MFIWNLTGKREISIYRLVYMWAPGQWETHFQEIKKREREREMSATCHLRNDIRSWPLSSKCTCTHTYISNPPHVPIHMNNTQTHKIHTDKVISFLILQWKKCDFWGIQGEKRLIKKSELCLKIQIKKKRF